MRATSDQRDSAAAGPRRPAGRPQEQHVLRRVLRQGRDGPEYVRHHARRSPHRVQREATHGQVGGASGEYGSSLHYPVYMYCMPATFLAPRAACSDQTRKHSTCFSFSQYQPASVCVEHSQHTYDWSELFTLSLDLLISATQPLTRESHTRWRLRVLLERRDIASQQLSRFDHLRL